MYFFLLPKFQNSNKKKFLTKSTREIKVLLQNHQTTSILESG